MPSPSRIALGNRLTDVDDLISAHATVTGGGRGRPGGREGRALVRSGVILLAAATEAFIEELFQDAARLVFSGLTPTELADLFEHTTKPLNTANVQKTNLLYFNLGMPWVLRTIRWKKFSNESFKKSLNKLVEVRGQIAHGKQPGVTLSQLRAWNRMVRKFSEVFEIEIASRVMAATGTRPPW